MLKVDYHTQLLLYMHRIFIKQTTTRQSIDNSRYKYTAPYPSCPQPLQSDELKQLELLDDGTSMYLSLIILFLAIKTRNLSRIPRYQLLRRLAPYFRGRHTIEEIMWRENVSREQLNKLFAKHKNILVRVVHEGSNVNKEIMGIN